MAILGRNTQGTTPVYIGENDYPLCKYTPSENGTIDSITVDLYHLWGGGDNTRVALYANNAGAPGALLATSTSQLLGANRDWVTFTLSGTNTITSGTPIWIAVWTDFPGGVQTYSVAGASNQMARNQSSVVPFNWANPIGSPTYTAEEIALYVTYTPTGGGGGGGNYTLDLTPSSMATTTHGITLQYSGASGDIFSFTISGARTTSAGIFQASTGKLVKTLWNNVTYQAGTHFGEWDRTDDTGAAATGGPFVAKVFTNAFVTTWKGAIGNTSADLYGESVIRYLRGFQDMCISGSNMYYCTGFCEADGSNHKLLISDYQRKIDIIPVQNGDVNQETRHICTDGTRVYWAGIDSFDANKSFIFGTNVSNDAEVQFSSGTSTSTVYGRTYQWAIDVQTTGSGQYATGIAVMTSGNYLFVSKGNANQLKVFNKTSGAAVRTITVTNPRRLAIDGSGNLWMISGTNTVAKYTINGDGTISSATLTLSGLVEPLSLALTPDGSTIAVVDGGSSQQVKAFSTTDGSSSWTLGQAGGYTSTSLVANDRFMFNHSVVYIPTPFVAFQSDGSFWVGDGGNLRILKFNSSRVYQDYVMALGTNYVHSTCKNEEERVFGDVGLEFYRDRSIALGPNNGSWYLKRNWKGFITANYYQSNYDTRDFLHNPFTIAGRTFAMVRNNSDYQYRWVELKSDNTLVYTNTYETAFSPAVIQEDGSLVSWSSNLNAGATGTYTRRTWAGVVSNNPTWNTASTIANIPTITTSHPAYQQMGNAAITSNGVCVLWNNSNSTTGYHLGGIKNGVSGYTFLASPATTAAYNGGFPTDGKYDIGNGVEYAGGEVLAKDRFIWWNYIGEFWKNSQTNKWNMYDESGLLLKQFGITTPEAESLDGISAPREAAGNAFAISVAKYNDNYYIHHNDESVHGGIHEWEISNISSLQEHTTVLDSSYTLSLDTSLLTITPNSLTLEYDSGGAGSYSLTVDTTSMDIAGNDLTLLYNPAYTITLDTNNMDLAGNDVSLLYDPKYSLSIDSASISSTANNLTLTYDPSFVIDLENVDLTIASYDLQLLYDPKYTLEINPGEIDVTTYNLEMRLDGNYDMSINNKVMTITTNPITMTYRNPTSGGGGPRRKRFYIFNFFR